MELIAQLKQQHIEIVHFFEAIKSEMIKLEGSDNYLVEELNNLKEFLLEHLALEDKLLYPALEKSKFKEARLVGKRFSQGMKAISGAAMAFFENYGSMNLGDLLKSAKFKKDANLIILTVKKRVGVEEKILYPLYNKYCKKGRIK